MVTLKNILLVGFSFVLASSLYAGEFIVKKSELQEKDVDYETMHPINLARDGSYFVGVEMIKDLETRAKGFTRALKVIRFENKKLSKVDTIEIPVTQWVNAVVNDKKDEVCVIGNYGTKIVRANLNTLQVDVLWEHKKGKEGFKAGPVLLCSNEIGRASCRERV